MNMQQVYLWLSLYTSLFYSVNQKTGLPHRASGPWHGVVVTTILCVGGMGEIKRSCPVVNLNLNEKKAVGKYTAE